MSSIIMMHGLPASGKSTIASNIETYLQSISIDAKIVKSVATRDQGSLIGFGSHSIDETIEKTRKEKDDSYKKVLNIAENYIENKVVPILDSTYHISRRRQWVYDLSREKNSNIYVVWCILEDEMMIKSILDRRKKSKIRDNILKTYDAFILMKGQNEPLNYDEMGKNGIKLVKTVWNKGEVRTNFKKDHDFPLEEAVLKNRMIYNNQETKELL